MQSEAVLNMILWSANAVNCRSTSVERHGNLLACISDRMYAAMMLLGRTFPLRQCLNGHVFAFIVEDFYKSWRAGLEAPSEEEESDEEADPAEGKQQEQAQTVLQINHDDPPRCSQCNKRVWQV